MAFIISIRTTTFFSSCSMPSDPIASGRNLITLRGWEGCWLYIGESRTGVCLLTFIAVLLLANRHLQRRKHAASRCFSLCARSSHAIEERESAQNTCRLLTVTLLADLLWPQSENRRDTEHNRHAPFPSENE